MNDSLFGDTLGATSTGAALGGPYGAAAGAALGLGKYFLLDRPKYQRQLLLAARTQALSPWTHLAAQMPNETDPLSNAISFGSVGAGIGQQMDRTGNEAKLNQAQLNNLNAQTNFYNSVSGLPLNFSTKSNMSPVPTGSYQDFYNMYGNTLDDQNNQLYNLRRQQG